MSSLPVRFEAEEGACKSTVETLTPGRSNATARVIQARRGIPSRTWVLKPRFLFVTLVRMIIGQVRSNLSWFGIVEQT